jgi:cytochrome c oxidase cbb3-type subunit 1
MDSAIQQATLPEVYSDTAVRQFSIMAVVWGVVGMSVGLLIASQLAWPELTLSLIHI